MSNAIVSVESVPDGGDQVHGHPAVLPGEQRVADADVLLAELTLEHFPFRAGNKPSRRLKFHNHGEDPY